MSDQPTPRSTSDEAAALLGAAAHGDEAGSRLSRSALGPLRAYTLVLAALIAAFFLAIVYVLSDSDAVVVWIATGVYLVILAIAVVGYLRVRKATAPRSDWRMLIGTVATMVLFIGGVLLYTVLDIRSPALWIPYTVVMVLPLALSTVVRAPR